MGSPVDKRASSPLANTRSQGDMGLGPLVGATDVVLGDRVLVRDYKRAKWHSGTVKCVSPLKVLVDGWDAACSFTFVVKKAAASPRNNRSGSPASRSPTARSPKASIKGSASP